LRICKKGLQIRTCKLLLGGVSPTPFEKYARQKWVSSPIFGMNMKKIFETTRLYTHETNGSHLTIHGWKPILFFDAIIFCATQYVGCRKGTPVTIHKN